MGSAPENYKGLLGKPIRLMTQDESMLMVKLSFGDEARPLPPELLRDPSVRILMGRIALANITLCPRLTLFIAVISHGVPGRLVVWAYTLKCIAQDLGLGMLDIATFFNGYFSNGIPTDEAYNLAWDEQKIDRTNGSDNYLDTEGAWT